MSESKVLTVPKKILLALGSLVLICALALGGYVAYLSVSYYRIPDNTAISPDSNTQASVAGPIQIGVPYTAVTQNMGFGAYVPDYTFFLDEGVMKDGTPKKGTESRARSYDAALKSTNDALDVLTSLSPDFVLLQETDTDSDRSFHINQKEKVEAAFPGLEGFYSSNFHSPFLILPLSNPHGSVQSGILTLSKFKVDEANRRSYPIDESFPSKYFDLDRCFSTSKIPTSNGKTLVLINSHMSAYDKGGTSRTRQLDMLRSYMNEEYQKGNYVIAGGDWNQALCGSINLYPSEQRIPEWVAELNPDDLPESLSVVCPNNLNQVPTCRGVDIPYTKGLTYTCTIDGFIVSKNVDAQAYNVDTQFAYSDHNPVLLTFSLL